MIIYKDEADIAHIIQANASISYAAQVFESDKIHIPERVLASIYSETPDTPDLFYTKSVLCTTSMNKNDDTFLPHEVWSSRKTPVDKFSNLNHDPNKLVGHITCTWAIDGDGNLLADNLTAEELPPFFHLCNGSVVYRRFADETLQAQSDELVEQIKAGEMFVSLEAFFSNFDYALVQANELVVIPRTSETSFLTKKLRCYGGEGLYDGAKIGRVLKNMTFGGVAFTPRPANPDSIIFSKIQNFEKVSNKTGVIKKSVSYSQENTMADNLLEKQVDELKAELKAAIATNKELNDKLASASTSKLEAEIASIREALAKAEKDMEDEKASKKQSEDAKCGLATELENLKAEYDKVKAELATMKTDLVKSSRVSKLLAAGLSKEDAEVKAATFAGLNDEQFDSLATILASVNTKQETVVESKETESEKAESAQEDLKASEEEKDIDATASTKESVSELIALVQAHYENKFVVNKEKK